MAYTEYEKSRYRGMYEMNKLNRHKMLRMVEEASENVEMDIIQRISDREKRDTSLRVLKKLKKLARDEAQAYFDYRTFEEHYEIMYSFELRGILNEIENEEYHHFNELIDAIRRLPHIFKTQR